MSLANNPVHPTESRVYKPLMGITLLQHYAGLAMQGMLGGEFGFPHEQHQFDLAAKCAVQQAKALIAALEKEEQQ